MSPIRLDDRTHCESFYGCWLSFDPCFIIESLHDLSMFYGSHLPFSPDLQFVLLSYLKSGIYKRKKKTLEYLKTDPQKNRRILFISIYLKKWMLTERDFTLICENGHLPYITPINVMYWVLLRRRSRISN